MQTLLDPPIKKTLTYHATLLSTALSPITHMSGTEGNEAIVMREPVSVDGDVRWVPVLSGNAIRHRMVRAPGVRYLINRWNLGGQLTLAQLNLLFHGGNLTSSNSSVSIERTKRLYEAFPLLRCVGCSVPDQILAGNLDCDRGILVCRENERRIARLLPSSLGDAADLRPAAAFVAGYQYTRNEARVSAPDLPPSDSGESSSNMMIFAGQSIIAGAVFLHGFTLRHVTPIELGSVLLSLRLWKANGGTIGGQAGKGHGKLDTALYLAEDVDHESCVAEYVEHVESHKAEGIALLNELFASKSDKPKRGRKGKQVDDAELPDDAS